MGEDIFIEKYIIALNQGTTSSRAIIFDRNQHIVGVSQREFTQIYPREGWGEHDPMEIWATQYGALQEVMEMPRRLLWTTRARDSSERTSCKPAGHRIR